MVSIVKQRGLLTIIVGICGSSHRALLAYAERITPPHFTGRRCYFAYEVSTRE